MAVENITLFLSRPKKILSFFGVWLQPNNHIILRKLYMLFVFCTQYSFLLFEIVYIVTAWGDMDAVSEASYLLFTQASLCYKSTAFVVNKNNLLELLAYMDCDIFKPKTDKHEKILAAQALKLNQLCLFFLASATTTCTLWGLVPLFARKRSFPFKIWMPVSTLKSPQFELGYLYQMVSIYISELLFSSVDGVAVAMMMFGCAQLEIIMDKIQKVENIYHSDSVKPKENREELIKMNNDLIVECVKQHQTIERFIQLSEDTYHANIFFQLSGTVAIICNIGLRISIVEEIYFYAADDLILETPNYNEAHDSVQFYSMLAYMVTILSQLFLYCWCGHELTIRSENLREWLYQCLWYEQDVKFRRALWIAMERMKKPIIFKAGHYISLSRPTFVAIIRCSYSYFAVLNRSKDI